MRRHALPRASESDLHATRRYGYVISQRVRTLSVYAAAREEQREREYYEVDLDGDN